jgi:hypothetical protein
MLVHNYNNVAGTVQYWDTSDSQENYLQNFQNPNHRKFFEQHGYTEQSITYRFNSEGFRGSEFADPECVCFGCSFTMGTGIAEEHTWPAQFSKLTRYSVANFGLAGSSNDTAVRLAVHYIPKFKPKIAIWLQTDSHRIEVVNEHTKISDNILAGDIQQGPYRNDYYLKQWFASDINQDLNLLKNTSAFKQVCAQNQVQCIIVPRKNVFFIDRARDLQHPGPNSNKKLAEEIARLV